MIQLLFLFLALAAFPAHGQRVTEGLVAEYRFSQCDCDAGSFPSELSNPTLPLTGACPTLTIPGFTFNFPTTQGVTTGAAPFAVVSGNTDFEDIDIVNTSGFTLEHFVDPKEEGSFVLSELLDADDNVLLSVVMAVSETSVSFTVAGSEDSGLFEIPQTIDPVSVGTMHAAIVFENIEGGFNVSPCIDATCALTAVAVNASLDTFSKIQILGVDNAQPTAAQMVTFAIYDRNLDEAEIGLNNADRSLLVDIPVVASELFIESQEDDKMIVRLDELSFFQSNQALDVVPGEATFTVNDNIITGAGQLAVDLPLNVFTTVGSDDCAFITPGANAGGAENSVGVMELECSAQTVDIRLCIREVNDPPVVLSQNQRNLFFADKFDKVIVTIVATGTDVDDDDSFALVDPVPVNPGKFRGLGTLELAATLFLNYTRFDSEALTCTDTIISEVAVKADGSATFCVSPSSVDLFTENDVNLDIEYVLVDAAGAESASSVLPIVIVADFLSVGADILPIVFLSGIVVFVLLLVCGIAYKLKQRADEGDSNPIGNFLGGNLAY